MTRWPRLRKWAIFQFTPLREGRRRARPCRYHRRDISIHAPAGGATSSLTARNLNHLFQFTPLREGRRTGRSRRSSNVYFNSRPCGRGDLRHERAGRAGEYFNSRPCGRGDPSCTHSARCRRCHFNSRPCGRGDA